MTRSLKLLLGSALFLLIVLAAFGSHSHLLARPISDTDVDVVSLKKILVPEQATAVAVASGNWSASSTWRGGQIPPTDSLIHIPTAITVTIDDVVAQVPKTVRVDGTLRFAPDKVTRLTVETLLVYDGKLEIGTTTNPIAASAEIIFKKSALDSPNDPRQLKRGLVVYNGTLQLEGAAMSSYLPIAQAKAGQNQLVLKQAATNWQVGQTLLIPGTIPNTAPYLSKITQVSSDKKTFTMADNFPDDRTVPADVLAVSPRSIDNYAGNLDRTITIRSEEPTGDHTQRGHVLITGGGSKVNARGAAFKGLGRSHRIGDVLISSDILNADGTIQTVGTNHIGRYAFHLHKTGYNVDSPEQTFDNNVVADAFPAWSLVLHSSKATLSNNIIYRAAQGITLEDGPEFGLITKNMIVDMTGKSRIGAQQPLAHGGVGIWSSGRNVPFINNVIAYVQVAGIMNNPNSVPSAHVYDARGPFGIKAEDNLIFVAKPGLTLKHGFEVWNNERNSFKDPTIYHTYRNNTIYNLDGYAYDFHYSQKLKIDGAVLINARGTVKHNVEVFDFQVLNSHIRETAKGIAGGIEIPFQGPTLIANNVIESIRNIYVTDRLHGDRINTRHTVLQDNTFMRFGDDATGHIDIQFLPVLREKNNNRVFGEETVLVKTGNVTQQVYANYMAADFVPSSILAGLPKELLLKTNKQLRETYGLNIGNAITPASATAVSSAETGSLIIGNGLIGPVDTARVPYIAYAPGLSEQSFGGNTRSNNVIYNLGDRTECKQTLAFYRTGWNFFPTQPTDSATCPIANLPKTNLFYYNVENAWIRVLVAQVVSADNKTVTNTLTTTNSGRKTAINARFTLPIPAGATLVSASDGGTLQGNTVVWTIDQMIAGSGKVLTAKITLP